MQKLWKRIYIHGNLVVFLKGNDGVFVANIPQRMIILTANVKNFSSIETTRLSITLGNRENRESRFKNYRIGTKMSACVPSGRVDHDGCLKGSFSPNFQFKP